MNLRKIFARTIAVASCAAMLSTNVLAASVSIGTAEADGKLKVTLSGDATGQVTFLATDTGVELAAVDGAKIQYIEQDEKTAGVDLNYTFAKRAGATNTDTVNLYSGGENVTDYASKTGVYVVAKADVTTTGEIAYTATEANDFNADKVAATLNGKVSVSYIGIGKTAAEAETKTYGTDDGFTFGAPVADGANEKYTIAVSYKGIAAGNVIVAETDPKAATAVTVTNAGAAQTFYYDSAVSEFDADEAKALLKDVITVKVDYDDGSSDEAFDTSKLTYTVGESGAVSVSYSGITAATAITVDLVQKAITGATATGTKAVTLNVRPGTEVTEAAVIGAVKAADDDELKISFAWNYDEDVTTTADLASDEDVAYAAVDNEDGTWTVTVTSPKATLADCFVTVTVVEASAFGIKGKVTVADTWGITGSTTFTDAIPVGAVVTAIPATTGNNTYGGNVMGDTGLGYTAKSAIVDAEGNYELELEPGTYNVFVSHTRYVVWKRTAAITNVSVYRTVLEGNANNVGNTAITISDSDTDLLTHNVALRYAYAGDMNLDGTLNNADFGLFKPNFGIALPAIGE